jgi:hypothetical protein
MKELGKFFRIYYQKAQKSWPELIPHVETFFKQNRRRSYWVYTRGTDVQRTAPGDILKAVAARARNIASTRIY